MGSNLDGATLTAAVPLDHFIAGTSITVRVNLTWIGIGSISRGRSRSRTHEPGVTIVSVFNGSTREATASGTISDGETNCFHSSGPGRPWTDESPTLYPIGIISKRRAAAVRFGGDNHHGGLVLPLDSWIFCVFHVGNTGKVSSEKAAICH